jgi:hypothetical protein
MVEVSDIKRVLLPDLGMKSTLNSKAWLSRNADGVSKASMFAAVVSRQIQEGQRAWKHDDDVENSSQ